MANPYLTSKVMTADPGQLLLMLYDGAIRFNDKAVRALTDSKPLEAIEPLGRTLAIVQELHNTLDTARAPELCANLERLYIFLQDQILQAQSHKDPARLEAVGRILRDLREGWSQAIQQTSHETGAVRRLG
jgi:flagellar protein FliS